MANATSTQLQELYVAYFGRAADPAGLDYWKEKGITTAAFAADMYAAPEFKSEFGSLTTEAQVNQVYKNLFDRSADVTGLLYWTQQINLGKLQLAEIAVHLIYAAQNNAGSEDDKTALTNRTNAAIAYTAEVKLTNDGVLAYAPLYDGKGTEDFSAGDNITAAKAYMAGIDKDTAHTAAGITASVNTIKTNGIPADTTTSNHALTTSTDFKTLTSGNDTINASGTTLGSDDVITDLGGSDTLKVSVAPASAASVILNTTGVETIQVTNTGSAAQEYNFAAASGVTTVATYLGTAAGDVKFTDLQANAKVVLDGSKGDVHAEFTNSVVVGSADTANIEIKNDASTALIAIGDADDEFETINISVGSGKNSITNIQDPASTPANFTETSKIAISGSGQLTLGAVVLKDKGEIDGSAATGKLLITHDETVDTLTGGSGDDTFTLTVGDFGSAAAKTIDGGPGTDTISISADLAASDFTANDNSDGSAAKHVIKAEVVDRDTSLAANAGVGVTSAVDVGSVEGVTKVTGTLTNIDSADDHYITYQITGLPAAGTVDVSSSEHNAAQGFNVVTMALENASGTADALTFDGDGTLSKLTMVNTSDDSGTPTITETGDIETLTISSSDVVASTGVAKTLTIGTLTGDDLTKINIVGSNAITISEFDLVQSSGLNSASVSTANRQDATVEIDASTSTGAVSISTTETGVLKITGGSGKLDVDLNGTATVSSTKLADVITGGSGTTDTVTVHDSTTAATFYPNTTGVEILQIETITSGAKTTSLANTTGVTSVEIIDETTGGGFGTTVAGINGQVIKVVTNDAGTDDHFDNQAIVLKVASGVTNTDVEITNSLTSKKADGVGIGTSTATAFTTDSTSITINDTNKVYAATGDQYLDSAYSVGGIASTADLATLTIKGGGDTDTSTTAMDANTHTVTTGSNVAITTIDATEMVASLDISGATIGTGATVKLGSADTTTTVAGTDLVADELKFTDAGGKDILLATSLGDSGESAIRLNSSGIETTKFTVIDDAGTGVASTFDMRDAVGLTTFQLAVAATADTNAAGFEENLTISNLANNAKVILTGADAQGTLFGTATDTTTIDAAISGATDVTVTNKSAGGTLTVLDMDFGTTYKTVTISQEADQDFDFTDVAGTKVTTLNIGAANSLSNGTAIADADMDIATATFAAATTINIDSNAGDITLGSTLLSATKLTTLDIVGDKTINFGAASDSTTTKLATVTGSTATGAITFGTSVDFANAADIKTGTGNDSLNLVTTVNANTALDMGEKASDTDTLRITGVHGLGITTIDLSAADQISQWNGQTNSAVQAGIENIDVSAMTGAYGTVITGNDDTNLITGSINADNITSNGGTDVIDGKAGDDDINITDATSDTTNALKKDTVNITESGNGTDTITGFVAGKDVLDISVSLIDEGGNAVDLAAFTTAGTPKDVTATNFAGLTNKDMAISTGFTTSDVILAVHSSVGVATLTETGFRTIFGAGGTSELKTGTADNVGQYLIIAYSSTNTSTADAGLFHVDFAADTTAQKTIHANDTVTHLATLKGVGADTLTASDFI